MNPERFESLCKEGDLGACKELARASNRMGNWSSFIRAVYVSGNQIPVPGDTIIKMMLSILSDPQSYSDVEKRSTLVPVSSGILSLEPVALQFQRGWVDQDWSKSITLMCADQYFSQDLLIKAVRKGFGDTATNVKISGGTKGGLVSTCEFDFTSWNVPASWSKFMDVSEDYGPVRMKSSFVLWKGKPIITFEFVKGHKRSVFEVSSLLQLGKSAHGSSKPKSMKKSWFWEGSDYSRFSVDLLFQRVVGNFSSMRRGLGV